MEELKGEVDPVFFKGKKIGEFYTNMSGHLVYQTRRVEEKNQFMRIVNGFGIQKEIIERFRLEDPKGIINVTYHTKTEGIIYLQAPVSSWLTKGVTKNFGYGQQLLLSISDMTRID